MLVLDTKRALPTGGRGLRARYVCTVQYIHTVLHMYIHTYIHIYIHGRPTPRRSSGESTCSPATPSESVAQGEMRIPWPRESGNVALGRSIYGVCTGTGTYVHRRVRSRRDGIRGISPGDDGDCDADRDGLGRLVSTITITSLSSLSLSHHITSHHYLLGGDDGTSQWAASA